MGRGTLAFALPLPCSNGMRPVLAWQRKTLETIIMEATQTMNAIRSHHRGGSETLVYEPVARPRLDLLNRE